MLVETRRRSGTLYVNDMFQENELYLGYVRFVFMPLLALSIPLSAEKAQYIFQVLYSKSVYILQRKNNMSCLCIRSCSESLRFQRSSIAERQRDAQIDSFAGDKEP